MSNKTISVNALLDRIYSASPEELNSILNAASERFAEIYPEWELMTITVPGHDRDSHIQALKQSLSLLEKL